MSNQNNGDSATENALPKPSLGLDLDALAKQFSSVKEEVVEQEATENEVSEVEEANETEETTDALSESNEDNTSTDETNEEDESEDEEGSEEEDSGENDVLSKKYDKTLNKLRKRIDKTTKNWREAEEKAEYLEQKIKRLEEGNSEVSRPVSAKGISGKAEEAESIEELEKVRETAKFVKQNAKRLLAELEDSGNSEIEYNGKQLTKKEIRLALDDAEEALDTHISQRTEMFKQKAQWDKQAVQMFDFLNDSKNEYYKFAQQIIAEPQARKFLAGRADEMLWIGLLAEGKRALDARQKQKQTQEKGKTEGKAKADSTPKIAPKIPGIKGVAPARVTADNKLQKEKEKILSRNVLNQNDLALLLSKQ